MVQRVDGIDLMGRGKLSSSTTRRIIATGTSSGEEEDAPPMTARGARPKPRSSETKAARVWINGIGAFSAARLKAVYDLRPRRSSCAAPVTARGSCSPGWCRISSLMDAIESGIVKVPRVPTRDDVIQRMKPKFRHIYKSCANNGVTRRGRRARRGGDPRAIFRRNLKRRLWRFIETTQRPTKLGGRSRATPVFIVVCNNTSTSKMVYEWISGY